MANAKDLRKRISSVKNTQQITRAMKMVSAAKLRRAQEAVVSLRPYAAEISSIVNRLSTTEGEEQKHELLMPKTVEEVQKILVLVVTSDRGLCGAFNANVIKTAQRYARTHAHKYKKFDFAFIGKKGFEFFKNKRNGKYYSTLLNKVTFTKADELAKELIQLYLDGEYDEIKFVYNEFKSAIAQKTNVETFLPIKATDLETNTSEEVKTAPFTIFEPNRAEILNKVLPKHFSVQAYRVLLESLASEHGARMSAMENATKNAGEMIRKLTLIYNKTRQAGITKELLEITSGTEAQKN
jgi:F-type H+-transporting ATPase subunit gamma